MSTQYAKVSLPPGRIEPPPFTGNESHIWIADFDRAQPAPWACHDLPPDEVVRASRIAKPADRARFAHAHKFLRRVLEGYTGTDAPALTFHTDAFGRPTLAHDGAADDAERAPWFSLSHSSDLVAVAVSPGRYVGVDVELAVEMPDLMSVAESTFAQEEIDALKSCEPESRVQLFYSIWTRKEACAKACGLGLSIPLSTFTVLGAPTDAGIRVLLPASRDLPTGLTLSVRDLPLRHGYASACALQEGMNSVRICGAQRL